MKQQKLLPVKSFSPLTLAVAMLVLTVATATTAEAQTFSVLYTFGSNTGDPYNTQYPGLIAQGRDGDLYSTSLFENGKCFGMMVAREGVEPPTPAFSGLRSTGLTTPSINNLTRQDGRFIVTIL
jgi:hypothetical protein